MERVFAAIGLVSDDLIALGFTLLGAGIFYLFRSRVKLIFGRANNSHNTVTIPAGEHNPNNSAAEIYIEKFFLQNVGRKPATDVEFVLSEFPTDVSVFQPRDVKYVKVQKTNCLIAIPRIAPGELVIIDCAYINQRAAFVTSVKCAEALGKEVPFWTLRRYPTFLNYAVIVLMMFGIAYLVQICLSFIS